MRDKSKKLTVVNTSERKKSESTVLPVNTPSKSVSYLLGGGGAEYLLKSIWDKVFEIKKDASGVEYIYGKLPVVTQYGVTMYSGNEVDVPGLYEGLPIDGETIKWVDGVLTAVSGGGGLDETQLAEYLTNNNYAKTSDITSALSGYATATQLAAVNTRIDNFLEGSDTDGIINKWLELEAFLSGLSQSDNLADILSTKISRTEASTMFVTTDETKQTILGEKNFTGGLLVNGRPIYYDAKNKYWKLEGDLLVTGGVTMYADEGTYTPSTIMDALLLDPDTLEIDSEGRLTVIGGTSSGGTVSGDYLPLTGGKLTGSLLTQAVAPSADNTYSFGYSNYRWAAGHFANLYVSGNSVLHLGNYSSYALPLSGGTINGTLTVDTALDYPFTIRRSNTNASYVAFENANGYLGDIGFLGDGTLYVYTNGVNNTLWHSGNDGAGSGLDADTLDGLQYDSFFVKGTDNTYSHGISLGNYTAVNSDANAWNNAANVNLKLRASNNAMVFAVSGAQNDRRAMIQVGHTTSNYAANTGSLYLNLLGGKVYIGTTEAATINSNVASATKLQTARTIWGQSFDGSADITKGDLTIMPNSGFSSINLAKATDDVLWQISGRYSSSDTGLRFYYYDKTTWNAYLNISTNGYVGINVRNPSYPLHLAGQAFIESGTAYGLMVKRMANGGAFTQYLPNNQEQYSWAVGSDSGYRFGAYYKDTASNIDTEMMYVDSSGNLWAKGQGKFNEGLALNRGSDNTTAFILGKNGTTTDFYIYNSSGYGRIIFGTNTSGSIAVRLAINYSGITVTGDILSTGGITMYSDIRKKTKLQDVELSLKQIANAPLIEHFYNSDEQKTTHVGSIAQYWAGINDWFCKLDGEGYYTMEIQNAALASAISIARELTRYESKTDKKIRKMQQRIIELEDELEKLKRA